MSKPDLKEYLTKIYGLQVSKVATANISGKIKSVVDARGKKHAIKRPDWKKAWVELEMVPEQHLEAFEAWNAERDRAVLGDYGASAAS